MSEYKSLFGRRSNDVATFGTVEVVKHQKEYLKVRDLLETIWAELEFFDARRKSEFHVSFTAKKKEES